MSIKSVAPEGSSATKGFKENEMQINNIVTWWQYHNVTRTNEYELMNSTEQFIKDIKWRQFISSWTFRRFFPCDQWSWCAVLWPWGPSSCSYNTIQVSTLQHRTVYTYLVLRRSRGPKVSGDVALALIFCNKIKQGWRSKKFSQYYENLTWKLNQEL